MGLKINHIISLDNNEEYILLNNALWGGKRYFLAMGFKNNRVDSSTILVLEEIIKNKELFVKIVNNKEILIPLMRIFKAQNTK